MMVQTYKHSVFFILSLTLLSTFSLFVLCGCSHTNKVINTYQMPGHKFSDMLQNNTPLKQSASKKTGITRTKSGVYIYKDDSVTNTTGYNFRHKDKSDVGPNDVRFDAENFRTKY